VNSGATGEELLDMMRQKILARGTRGILAMGKLFKIIDDNNSRSLDMDEFRKVTKELRLNFSDAQAKKLFNYFDRDKTGSIDYDEFLRYLRGDMN
jgi:Ca2+-binding EF-hand superfamily protein